MKSSRKRCGWHGARVLDWVTFEEFAVFLEHFHPYNGLTVARIYFFLSFPFFHKILGNICRGEVSAAIVGEAVVLASGSTYPR